MTKNWCKLSLSDWSGLTVDHWSGMEVCPALVDSPVPFMVHKGLPQPDRFVDFPIVDAIPAGETTANSVLLPTGAFKWSQTFLAIPSIGGFAWRFGVSYQNQVGSAYPIDDLLGPGFTFPQETCFRENAADPTKVLLCTPEQTVIAFDKNGERLPSGRLFKTINSESDNEEIYILTDAAGTRSYFYTLNSDNPAPGRLYQISDRYGNTQRYVWEKNGPLTRLTQVTDPYGHSVEYRYDQDVYGGQRLTEVAYSAGLPGKPTAATFKLQYDNDPMSFLYGHLVAVVLPEIQAAAPGNTFPRGTAYAFAYDDRRRLEKIWYPDQTAGFIQGDRSVDVAGLRNGAAARYTVAYDDDDRVVAERVGSPDGAVGGTYRFSYKTLDENPASSDTPASETRVTDRNGNVTIHQFNSGHLTLQREVQTNRGKLRVAGLQTPTEYATRYRYNADNQPVEIALPRGNSIVYEYDTQDDVVEIDGQAYQPFVGRLRAISRKTTNSLGIAAQAPQASNGQTEHTTRFYYEPLYNQLFATVEPRGNPVNGSGDLFPAQNGGGVSQDRYATLFFYDYQQANDVAIASKPTLQRLLFDEASGTSEAGILGLLADARSDTASAGLDEGRGFATALGIVNGDPSGFLPRGRLIKVRHPSVRLPDDGTQKRIELYTHNDRGQVTSRLDPEGNLTAFVYHPQSAPGGSDASTDFAGSDPIGYLAAVHVDTDPQTLGGIVPSLSGYIRPGEPARANSPDVYQNLVTRIPRYDLLGRPIEVFDPRDVRTGTKTNELGETFDTAVSVAALSPLVRHRLYFDRNRNVVRQDIANFTPLTDANGDLTFDTTGVGSQSVSIFNTADMGWLTHFFRYDFLDDLIEEDLDATRPAESGGASGRLVTRYAYDPNQNPIRVRQPEGNLIEFDYDERDLMIAQRVGREDGNGPLLGASPAVTALVYDANGNATRVIGPENRAGGSGGSTIANARIGDAFGGGDSSLTGDAVTAEYDGFDRPIRQADPLGNTAELLLDPGGRVMKVSQFGPATIDGPLNTKLAAAETLHDEAGRAYEQKIEVSFPGSVGATQIGGGLTDGSADTVMSRTIYDRADRPIQLIQDNAGQTTLEYDGANRLLRETDPLDNAAAYEYDAVGNVTRAAAIEQHPDRPGVTETFISAAAYDGLNRPVISMMQGADGSLDPDPRAANNATIFHFQGYDSRSNATHFIDPRNNPSRVLYDGVNRPVQTVEELRAGGDGGGANQSDIKTTYEYDRNDNLARVIDDNGNSTRYRYDTLNRQAQMTLADGSLWSQLYNRASDVVRRIEPNGNVLDYSYDGLGRLKQVVIRDTGADVVGQSSGIAQAFEYDGLSRVIEAIDHTAENDAPIQARVTDYVYNGEDQVCEEYDPNLADGGASGGPLRQFIWGQYVDELIQQREHLMPDGRDHTDLYPLSDLHYRTAALTDSGGRIIEAYDSDTYGNTMIFTGCGADGQWFTDDDLRLGQDEASADAPEGPLTPYLYLGYRYDAETGLYVAGNGVRYYSPTLGRFTQYDPAGYVDGMNLYEFLRSNPNAYVDPSGGSSQPGSSWYQELWWAYKHGFTDPVQNLSLQITNLAEAYPSVVEAGKLALEFPQNQTTIAMYMLSDPLGGAAQLFEAGVDTGISIGANTANAAENLVRGLWDVAAFGHNISLAGQLFSLPYAGRRYWAQNYGVGGQWYPATLSMDLIEIGLPVVAIKSALSTSRGVSAVVRNQTFTRYAGRWEGIGKGFSDTGRYSWASVRRRWLKNGRVDPRMPIHHRLIAQGGTRGGAGRLNLHGFFAEQYGRYVPNVIKNSSWNLTAIGRGRWTPAFHNALHGKNPLMRMNLMSRIWYGTTLSDKAIMGGGIVGGTYAIDAYWSSD